MSSRVVPLSDEQLAALAPHVRLIEAGPGSGKTRTVVARLRHHVQQGRHVALLSFTNAAVDVAKARCHDLPASAEPPNFIGTFDQFFHRYVLTPEVRKRYATTPRYVTSWDDLGDHIAIVRPPGGGTGIPLSRFVLEDGNWKVDETRLRYKTRQWWNSITPWSRGEVHRIGHDRIKGLHASHVYDPARARTCALTTLQNDTRYLTRLKHRFAEVIVDEFQDCDIVEYQLLDLLGDVGLPVVAVADPDQAIYEFRQATPGLYEQRRTQFTGSAVAPLTTCYRSTPAICALVSSLRTVGVDEVRPDPEHSGGAEVIHVVVGKGTGAGVSALKIIQSHGVNDHDVRIVAHRRSAARALTGQGEPQPDGTSQMEALLAPLADLRSSTDPRERRTAVRRVEKFILNQFAWPAEAGHGATDDLLQHLEIPPDHLRFTTGRILTASHDWTTAKACSTSVRAILENYASGMPVGLHATIKARLKSPTDKVWNFWRARIDGTNSTAGQHAAPWTHIHSVKGDEFDAVVLAIPSSSPGSTHVLDDWENDRNTEQRRVLYVGASRAAKILVLAVSPGKRANQLERILAQARIPYTVTKAVDDDGRLAIDETASAFSVGASHTAGQTSRLQECIAQDAVDALGHHEVVGGELVGRGQA